MKNISTFVFAILFFIGTPLLACAQVVITEIMYDLSGTDTDREWIEVKNNGSNPVDVSLFKLFEANTNHKITSIGENVIPSGGYAIIAPVPEKFKADYPNFSGLIFDSVFSLGNEGETLVLYDSNQTISDSVSYSAAVGAKGDGNSLQKTSSGIWIGAFPTPGGDTTETESVVPVDSNTSTENDDEEQASETQITSKNSDVYSTHSSQAVANVSFDAPELVVTGGRPRIGFVGTPLLFEAKVKNMKHIPAGNALANTWTMGDGFQKSGQFISHTYEYPGEYVVVLNSSIGGAEAVSKIKVKILEPKVTIKTIDDGSIEISNNDSYELNIGSWFIETGKERKIIPLDTIILPRASIRVLAQSVGLRTISQDIKLINPSGKVLSQSIASNQPQFFGDVTVLLPEGMTETSLRENFSYALQLYEKKPSVTFDEHVGQKTEAVITQNNFPLDDTMASNTLPAALLYAIPKNKEASLWQRFKQFFKK